jgi:hypothetical protein
LSSADIGAERELVTLNEKSPIVANRNTGTRKRALKKHKSMELARAHMAFRSSMPPATPSMRADTDTRPSTAPRINARSAGARWL